MPSIISVELSPASATNSMTGLAAPASVVPLQVQKPVSPAAISNPDGSAVMDHASMSHPHASPSSSASVSFSSSSTTSSPSSSTLSLPPWTLSSADKNKDKDKGKGKARAFVDNDEAKAKGADGDRVFCPGLQANQDAEELLGYSQEPKEQQQQQQQTNSKEKGKGKEADGSLDQSDDDSSSTPSIRVHSAGSTASSSHSKSGVYTHSNSRSSKSSSFTSLSSVEEEDDVLDSGKTQQVIGSNGKDKTLQSAAEYNGASGSGSNSGASSAQCSYFNGVGSSSSGSGNGSSSGSSSKPALNRATTGPSTLQRPFLASAASSSGMPLSSALASPVPQEKMLSDQELALLSYDALPADFDFGNLPFYDTDPRTGIIYGDSHSITRPYLVPERFFDLYRLVHDPEDPRKTNFFNKHNILLYQHPGRHIGQDQDSLRSNVNNLPIWTIAGRTSTWGTLTATEMSTKRQIKIAMESNKKKAAAESSEPLARFVFRWKDDDFVVEYRKQKDQYRVTTSQ
ncbi:hypothetical protein BGZ65_001695, partial [Modicella reniformis]